MNNKINIIQVFKKILKIIPRIYKQKRLKHHFRKTYKSDIKRYLKYSRTIKADTEGKMEAAIILQYHVIEKGFTMPQMRLGFGQKRIINLSNTCVLYHSKFGNNNLQFAHACSVIIEYDKTHKKNNFELDEETLQSIDNIKNIYNNSYSTNSQLESSSTDYFKDTESPFITFSKSRHSVRNYSERPVAKTLIEECILNAHNAPSACNRQPWEIYVFDDRKQIQKILKAQKGSNGFNHLTDKLIIICSDLSGYSYTNERHLPYVDGGIYAMNLLYTLHYNKIAACILSCGFELDTEFKVRKYANIKENEVLIAMISCGYPPEKFKIASSPRTCFQ